MSLKSRGPLESLYELLEATDPDSALTQYQKIDQELMYDRAWDYHAPDFFPNKVKAVLEKIGPESLNQKERTLYHHLLWLWYHHAISCAIWRYCDKKQARIYAKKALEHQPKGHPNKITRLFYLLLHDKLPEAEAWTDEITTEPEQTTAAYLLQEYQKNQFDLCE